MATFNRFAVCFLMLFSAACSAAPGSHLLNPVLRHTKRMPMPPAKKKVSDLIQARIAAGDLKEGSVYFHALSTGYWFGLGEHQKFIPASLLKVYLLIRVLQEEESWPGVLKTSLELQDDVRNASQEILPYDRLVQGRRYTVEELLSHMIVYSDNSAAYTLHTKFGDKSLEKIYRDFGLQSDAKDEAYLTLKQYMMVFLSLYNGTYIGAAPSGRALQFLSRSEFKDGLKAGLPPGLPVAHKFGERGVDTPQGRLQQLHDCGIIYYGDYPYMLGVMTRGDDIKKLAAVIKDVSALIYAEVDYRSQEARK